MKTNSKNIVSSSHGFNCIGPVYCFTNENIAEYLHAVRIPQNGKVLTVGASGDQMFEAYLAGAAHVDTFDININQRYIIELKNHMIRGLGYEDFINFFFSKKSYFDTEILKPIEDKFSDGLRDFLVQFKESTDSKSMFKFRDVHNPDFDRQNISYVANRSCYKKLKSILPEQISFTQTDIANISECFTTKYDLIMLSNIFDYMYPEEPLLDAKYEKFYRNILTRLAKNNLNPQLGKICFGYVWNAQTPVWSNFMYYLQDKYTYRNGFNNISMNAHHFPSGIQEYRQDAVLVMTQRQR